MVAFCSFFFLLPASCLSCPEYQKQALLKFKSSYLAITSSFNSSDYVDQLQSWNSSSDCCEWHRVDCNDSPNSTSSRVVTLVYLTGLFGALSPQPMESTLLAPLFHIRTLEELDISDSNIQGDIPGIGFANLSSSLVHLDMSGNNFSGSIPPQLFHLPLLQNLYLKYNSLSGQLPAEIGNLTSLVTLYMEGNNFSGSFPPQLFHLPLLQDLFLDGNSLSTGDQVIHEEEIGNLTSLQYLSLSGNKFSDTILLSVLCLKRLEYLDLSHNCLSMEIPTEIGNLLPNISTLALSNNRLIGGIPPSMKKLSKLNQLYLQNNLLTGEIPSWLFDFKGLGDLYVGGNRLIWNESVEIAPNPRPFRLSLKSCGLVGEVPKWISTQTGLDFLDLSKNKLQGAFPQWFLDMELHGLILSDNEFTGSLPPALFSRLTDLGVLALSRNNFSGELPNNIRVLCSLKIVTLSDNNFSGPVPQSLKNCPYLQLLDLSRNQFSGPFPAFYLGLQLPLAYIDFSSNNFLGEVPTAFPEETRFLALGGNKFSGGLPFNLTNLSKLQRLELQDNNLTGELPDFLSQISTLQVLNLRNNNFQGSIPKSIFNLKNLRILDVSNNNLTGEIPEEFHNLTGMIEPPNSPSSILDTISISETSRWSDQEVQVSLEFNDLIVSWKNSKQGISTNKLNIYTLLDISNNQLSGQIPASLGDLKALKLLNISHNKLSGKIPTSLGDLENIETLDFSHNNLSGSIPLTLIKLQQLTILDVSNNELTGRIPNGGQMGTMVLNPNYFANNSKLCGIQIRVPCPEDDRLPLLPPPSSIKKHEPWFLWEGVWIGYPIGLLVAIGIMVLTGYFALPPPSSCRHRSHRRIRGR